MDLEGVEGTSCLGDTGVRTKIVLVISHRLRPDLGNELLSERADHIERVTRTGSIMAQAKALLDGPSGERNYSPPHRYEKFIPISPIAKRRNFESDGGSEPVRSVFGLGSVTFQKRRPKRLRDWPHDWRLAHNYYQRGGGSILA
jgi:hypothetical protein